MGGYFPLCNGPFHRQIKMCHQISLSNRLNPIYHLEMKPERVPSSASLRWQICYQSGWMTALDRSSREWQDVVKPTTYPLCSSGDLQPSASTGVLRESDKRWNQLRGVYENVCLLAHWCLERDVSHVYPGASQRWRQNRDLGIFAFNYCTWQNQLFKVISG